MAFLPPPLGVPGVTRTVAVAAEHAKQAAAVDLRLAAMCAEVRRLRRELSGAQAAIDATASKYQRTAAELEYPLGAPRAARPPRGNTDARAGRAGKSAR